EKKLSGKRRVLMRAVESAEQLEAGGGSAIIVTLLRSRFFRSEKDWKAIPTAEEFARFHELTRHFTSATLFDPSFTEQEEQSLLGKLLSKPRRSTIPYGTALRILEDLGALDLWCKRRGKREMSYDEVARRHGVTPSQVQRLVNRPVPVSL